MEREGILDKVKKTLADAKFQVSVLDSARPMSFDILARKRNTLLIIKVLTNIDAFSEDAANDLKTLSALLGGSPLIIGEKSSLTLLEDNVAYFRFGIGVITLDTLRKYLLEGEPVTAYAGPGGLYVNINEREFKKARKIKNISIGALARELGISRRMARMYEEGANARLEIARKIEKILGKKVISPIDLHGEQKKYVIDNIKDDIDRFKFFQREILLLIREIGYRIIPVEHCPFEAFSKEKKNVLLTCISKFNYRAVRKAKLVKDISKITEQEAVFFTDRYKFGRTVEGIPVILKSELEKMKDPEDILDMIIERKLNGE